MDFYSILMGIAIGDAYGAGIEFQDRSWIRENVDFSRFVNARNDITMVKKDNGDLIANYRDWEYTDDTEMTLGCIKAILSGKPLSKELLLEYWIKEYNEDKLRKGYGRHGHGSMRWVYNGEKTIDEVREFQSTRPNPGNGAVMRVIPFAFFPENKIREACIINSDATHPNLRSSAASVLVAFAAYHLILKGSSHETIIAKSAEHIADLDKEMYTNALAIDRLPSPENISEQQFEMLCGPQPIIKPWYPEGLFGLPSDAMYTALSAVYLLKHYKNTFEGLKAAIRLGGDVDSVASVVTGILAGRYGIESIPVYMKVSVEGKEMIKEIAKSWDEKVMSNRF